MSNTRLYGPAIRWMLAFPQAFANPLTPTTTELNNTTNGLIFGITCALDQANTVFNLDASDTDDSLSFCQVAGAVAPTFYNPTMILQGFLSNAPTATNQANTLRDLLMFPDVHYFLVKRVGKGDDAAFAVGDVVDVGGANTDYPVIGIGSSDNETIQSTLLSDGNLAWQYQLAS